MTVSFLPPVPDAPLRPFKEIIKNKPGIESKTVKSIKSVIREFRRPSARKPTTVPGTIINPKLLAPIHLRSKPLRPLSPTTEKFAVQFGAGNIVERRNQDWDNHVQVFEDQIRPPPRKKSIFVDDSAIEVDSEGEEIESSISTPPHSPPQSPIRTPSSVPKSSNSRGWGFSQLVERSICQEGESQSSPSTSNVVSSNVKDTTSSPVLKSAPVKRPKQDSFCETCLVYASGPRQLEIHLKSKKHLKLIRRLSLVNSSLQCSTCRTSFDNIHNIHNHKCKNFLQ